MPFIPFTDNQGQHWEVNRAGVSHLLRSSIYSAELFGHSRVEVETPFLGPTLRTLVTNFQGLVARVDEAARIALPNLEQQVAMNAEGAFGTLLGYRVQDLRANQQLRQMQRRASDQNWESIDRSVRIGTAGLQVAQTVRDLSVSTLLLGATALSGGAAAAALGAGAALHGTATYQNGGTVGDAVLAATADVVVGAFGIGLARSAQQAEVAAAAVARIATARRTGAVVERVMAVAAQRRQEQLTILVVGSTLDASLEAVKSAANGETLAQTARAAAARFAVDMVAPAAGRLISRVAVPVAVRMAPSVQREVVAVAVGVGLGNLGDRAVDRARNVPTPAQRQDAQRPPQTPYSDCTRLWGRELLSEREFVTRTALRRVS